MGSRARLLLLGGLVCGTVVSILQLHAALLHSGPPLELPGTGDLPQEVRVQLATHAGPVVRCDTTKGPFRVMLEPALAPNGTEFFLKLVGAGYFDAGAVPFFRVNEFITQFGISRLPPKGQDPFAALRRGAKRDWNPFSARPWPRGTLASIGGFHLVAVIQGNRHMGVNRHDAPMGTIPEADMHRVFDRLYRYNDIIDHPRRGPGVEQGKLLAEGMQYIHREFPLTDAILGCRLLKSATRGVGRAT